MKKPKVLIIFAKSGTETSTRYGGFVKRIKKNGGFKYADVDYVALEDLLFRTMDDGRAKVHDPIRKINLAHYSFVYFKSWQSMPTLAASAGFYLQGMGIPFADEQVLHNRPGKAANQMVRWASGVSVPATIWGSKKVLSHFLKTRKVQMPLVVKADVGQKGNDNFLVQTRREARRIIEESDKDFVLQAFVPNDGDYRIGVYGHKARWAIYRKSGGKSHLNNTSAGGEAQLLDITKLDPAVTKLAEKAAAASDLAVAGVDVVQDKETGKLYVFEANQGSQIVTGAFSDTNMTAFDEGLRAMVAKRDTVRRTMRPRMIGRNVHVMVENDSQLVFRAKVDTGAFRSALHAEAIERGRDNDGKEFVEYTLTSASDPSVKRTFRAYDFSRALIKSSNGSKEMRYLVTINVTIRGVDYSMEVTLTNRMTQKHPLLIGRRLLVGNFIVNPALSEGRDEEEL